MSMPTLTQMEDSFSRLTLEEQLWLMERLLRRIKESTVKQQSRIEDDLVAMANDPEIQDELKQIDKEMAI
ncbi:MAG: hypothetical protein KC546_16305 [Anaerolineae bacterium]|nr:hypothetical protein [Anaerolineae bacterium]